MTIQGKKPSAAVTPLLQSKRPRQRQGAALTNLPIRRAETRLSDAREQGRCQVPGARVRIRHQRRSMDVKVLNLSAGGAMIASNLRPNLSDSIEIEFDEGVIIESLVRWVKGGRIGLEFAHETQLQCLNGDPADLLRDVVGGCGPSQDSPDAPKPADTAEIRSDLRHPFIWSGKLQWGPHNWEARLRNISPRGALVEADCSVETGSAVVLDLGPDRAICAIVRWVLGDCLGLEFEEPFDLRLLSKSNHRLVPPTWSRPACLERHVPKDSPWDDAWNRMSPDELKEQLEGFLKR